MHGSHILAGRPGDVPWWLTVATYPLAVLALAKFHGVQVRLEREQLGFRGVRFGGENPPGVEAVWREDRRGFWTAFAVMAGLYAGLSGMQRYAQGTWDVPLLVAAVPWAFATSFFFAGAGSALRRWERLGRPAWFPWSERTNAWFFLGCLAFGVHGAMFANGW